MITDDNKSDWQSISSQLNLTCCLIAKQECSDKDPLIDCMRRSTLTDSGSDLGGNGLLVLETLDAHIVVDHAVDVDDDGAGLHVEQQERRRLRSRGGREEREGAGGGARVHKERAVALARLEPVRVARHEHVHVELPLKHSERRRVTPRNDL